MYYRLFLYFLNCGILLDFQNNLNVLHYYCNTWGLEVHGDKTKFMVFTKRGRLKIDEKWTYTELNV